MRKVLIMFLLLLSSVSVSKAAVPSDREAAAKRGRELFELGRWSDARQEFIAFRGALSTRDYAALELADYYLALCSAELAQPETEERLRAFIARYPASVRINDIHFALADWFCTNEEFDKAGEEFAAVDYSLLNAERRAEYDFKTGYIHFLDGDYDEARKLFSRVDASSSKYEHSLYYSAYIDYTDGDYASAKRKFTQLLDSESYAKLAPYYLLQIEYHEGNFPYVVRVGESLLDESSEAQRVELRRLISESAFRMNNYRKAVDVMRAYEGSGGEMGREENYILGYSLYRMTRYTEAREALRKVCGPDDELTQNASYHLADCYVKAGDKVAAADAFALASNDSFDARIAEDALFNYGKLRYELGGGNFNEAVNVLTRYIENYPDTDRTNEARELLVAAYFNSRNYESAYNAIKALPDPDSSILAALQKITYFRALESYSQGEPLQAQQLLDESISIGISPKYSALALFWSGEIAYGSGDYDRAAEYYSRYVDRAPKSEREYKLALYNLGYSNFSTGNIASARSNFASFLKLWPQQDRYRADALNRRGDTEYASREYAVAAKTYSDAAAVGTVERYYAQYQRALALGMAGRADEKIQLLKSIVEADRGDYADDAAYELGHTYITREQYRDGAVVLASFVERYPNSPEYTSALLDLGLAYLNMGDSDNALLYYSEAVAKDPNTAAARDALRSIREIYVDRGDVDAYFEYAAAAGVEGDMSNVARDSLTFESLQKIYVAGRTRDAIAPMENYLAQFPKGYHRTDVLFYLSDCHLRNGDSDKAIEPLRALADAPANKYTLRVLDKLSQLAYSKGMYAVSADAYRRLYETESSVQARNDAMTGYVRSVLSSGEPESISGMADYVASQSDAGPTALRESRYAKMKILLSSGDESGAMELCRLLADDVRYAEGAEAAYLLIESDYRGGRFEAVETAVDAFAERNTSQAYWLGKAFLVLGDVYRSRGDMFQARATYQSIVDGYSIADDGIIAEAKERIRNLN
ncbi:MAG: tetratricopeptide repeat protein [Alistipes sp.]|nr:tetratricopeptide repeat protein [Alistipes sp.]